jgi:hypothetical protein
MENIQGLAGRGSNSLSQPIAVLKPGIPSGVASTKEKH